MKTQWQVIAIGILMTFGVSTWARGLHKEDSHIHFDQLIQESAQQEATLKQNMRQRFHDVTQAADDRVTVIDFQDVAVEMRPAKKETRRHFDSTGVAVKSHEFSVRLAQVRRTN